MPTLSWSYKITLAVVFFLGFGGLYLLPNAYPPAPPAALPKLGLEDAIPLLPWMVPVYLSVIPLLFVPFFALKDRKAFHQYYLSMVLALVISGTVFWVFPTSIARPDELGLSGLSQWLIQLMHGLDGPANCFPSLHVAFAVIAAWNTRSLGRNWKTAGPLWALAITISVLTTKQHYLIDVLGGLIVAAVALSSPLQTRRRSASAPGRLGQPRKAA